MTRQPLAKFLTSPTCSIREVMACIDGNAAGVALIVDHEGRLITTVTDGDVRRAILAGIDLEAPATALQNRKVGSAYANPITAATGTDSPILLELMRSRGIQQIPLVDERDRVVDVVTLDELLPPQPLLLQAVVMAGGYGSRLRPLTDEVPKALLPIGDRPILELILKQLQRAGVTAVSLATHYKSELIAERFGDGHELGMTIRYLKEDQPLGTAGALGLLDPPANQPLLVINGDILTGVDFRAMLDFHLEHHADMTVAVRPETVTVPYGVVESVGIAVTGITEKPVLKHFINAGIYLLQPGLCRLIPIGQRYDMPDLIHRLVTEGRQVISFPVREYWLDIGHLENYKQAMDDHLSEQT